MCGLQKVTGRLKEWWILENKESIDEKNSDFFFSSLAITSFPVHEEAEKKEISFI